MSSAVPKFCVVCGDDLAPPHGYNGIYGTVIGDGGEYHYQCWAMPRRPRWHTIDTAPKDGTRILAYGKIGLPDNPVGIVSWGHYGWGANDDPDQGPWPCQVTHWMPLPAAPDVAL